MPAYVSWDGPRTVIRPTAAQVVWAGSGGYWSRANLVDILEPPVGDKSK